MGRYRFSHLNISAVPLRHNLVVALSLIVVLLSPAAGVTAQQSGQGPQPVTALERSQILLSLFHPVEILGQARLESLRITSSMESSGRTQRRRSRRAVPDSIPPDNQALTEARSLISRGNTAAARMVLDEAFRNGNPHPEVPFLLAELYLAELEPGGRLRAEELISEALRRSPGNIRYRLTRVRLFRGQTFTEYAELELDRILRDLPTQAEALAYKGQFGVERLTYADWRKSGWSDFIERQFISGVQQEALENLASAIAIDSLNVRAHHWLAYFYLHRQDWKNAMKVCNRMMRLGLEPGLAHLGRGLALFHLRLYDDAEDAFNAASRSLGPGAGELIWTTLWATPIVDVNRTGRGAILDSERAVPARGDTLFWAALDPVLSDDVNLRALEQARRLAHVAWFYGVETLGLHGWETLMGQIYLRYGKPRGQSSIIRQVSGQSRGRLIDAQGTAAPVMPSMRARLPSPDGLSKMPFNVVQFPSQMWNYGDFTIPLGLGFFSGNLEFIIQLREENQWYAPNWVDSSELYQKLTQTLPEISTIVGVPHPQRFPLITYQFPGPENSTDVVGVMEVDEDLAMSLLRGVSGFVAEPLLHAITFDLDSGERKMDTRSVFEQNRRWSSLPYFSKKYVLASPSMSLTTGSHLLSLEFVASPDEIWVGRDSVEVASADEPLRISDLVLASSIIPDTTRNLWPSVGTVNRSGWRIAPRLSQTFTPGEEKMLYLEFDGLQKDAFGATDYEIALSISRVRRRGLLAFTARLIEGIAGRRRDQEEVTVFWDRSGISTHDTEALSFIIPDPTEDEYNITLVVTDRVSGHSATTWTIMQISRQP
ncbi:tetratricopeptide repeat protein [Gemmatimonadota bacterium]